MPSFSTSPRDQLDRGLVVGDALVRAARLVDVDLGSSDVQAGQVLTLRSFDERGSRDDHVRLLRHDHAVGDDRHVAAAGDAVPEHAGDLGHAGSRELGVLLEDVARPGAAGEGARLFGEEEPGAVDEVHDGRPQPQRHLLGALDLLRRQRPPRARGDRVVVGDHHHPASRDLHEGRDDPGGRRLELAELAPVVDERADLEDPRLRVLQELDALARRALVLLVHPLGVLLPPARGDLLAAFEEYGLALGERLAVRFEATVVEEGVARSADRRQGRVGHGRSSGAAGPWGQSVQPGILRVS